MRISDWSSDVCSSDRSGSGKSVTALSVMRLLPYPMAQHPGGSSITFKDRQLIGADPRLLRDVRGDQISMIFQEPMTSLNPLHTVEKQINETLFQIGRAHV